MKRFKGQTQKWFLFKARTELEINLLNEVEQEFVDHQMGELLVSLIPYCAVQKRCLRKSAK